MLNIRNCIFGFKCTADWNVMKLTSEMTVRHCQSCEKDVYLISTKEQLFEAIDLNRCVAIQSESQENKKIMMPTLGVALRYSDEIDYSDDSDKPF